MKKENEISQVKREYLNEIKLLFPVMQKKEKRYLQFYSFFGSPNDVVHQYFSGMDTKSFCSYLKMRKLKRSVLLTLCSLILATTVIINIILWQEHLSVMRSEIVSVTSEIIEYEEVSP